MKNKIIFAAGFFTAISFFSFNAYAENLNDILKRVNDFVAQENYPKAMEELSWANKEIEKMHSTKLGQILPAEVNGFKGEAAKMESALGFTNVSKVYKNGSKVIKLNMSGASSQGGLGGLAGLAKMGMMMGGAQPGMETFRIKGRTANLDTQDSSPKVTVFLDSGSMLNIEAEDGVDAEAVKTFAEAIDVEKLDNYLKGSK
ncbi:MAG: hypothetical protein KBC84_08290 [Proteobacteria bacterium]|nr:hypothetical protein [Pseudomonadota bacterium]